MATETEEKEKEGDKKKKKAAERSLTYTTPWQSAKGPLPMRFAGPQDSGGPRRAHASPAKSRQCCASLGERRRENTQAEIRIRLMQISICGCP